MYTYKEIEKKFKVSQKTISERKKKMGLSGWNEEICKKLIKNLLDNPPKKTNLRKTDEIKLQNDVIGQMGLINQQQEEINEHKKVIEAIKQAYGNLLPTPEKIKSDKEQLKKLEEIKLKAEQAIKELERIKNRGFWARLLNK